MNTNGNGSKPKILNVLGTELETCSTNPMTGFYRDGCCQTGFNDVGTHTVCVIVTQEFLEFSRSQGNDLTTPRPEFQFPGLIAGDRWCLCASRWREALENDVAPFVNLKATHFKTLEFVTIADLLRHALED